MFGIDIGISVSSVSCVTQDGKVLDIQIIFGDKKEKNEWKRVTDMSEAIVNSITEMLKGQPGIYIAPLVSIEEPVYPYRTRNPRSYFNMCCLYALIRNKLSKRSFKIYSVNPITVKACARAKAFKGKKIKAKYLTGRNLNKTGMVRAFKKLVGSEPGYHTKVGKETLADSYFIAQVGLDRRRVGLK